MQWCARTARILSEGSELITGVCRDASKALSQQFIDIPLFDSGDLRKLVSEVGNFCVKLHKNEMVIPPPGMLYLIHRSVQTQGISWAFSPPLEGEDLAVRSCFSALLECTPNLKVSTYGEWLKLFNS